MDRIGYLKEVRKGGRIGRIRPLTRVKRHGGKVEVKGIEGPK